MAPRAVLVGMPGSGKSTIGRRLAKALDIPLYRLWGGYRDAVPIIAIAGYYEEGKGVEALTDEMIWLREQGMGGVKMKVGRYSVAEDIERFAYCRKGVDNSFKIAADSNRAWKLKDAIRVLQLNIPSYVKYSVVYQNVQSSTGSMLIEL